MEKLFADEQYHFTIDNGLSNCKLISLASSNSHKDHTHFIGVDSTGQTTIRKEVDVRKTSHWFERFHVKIVARIPLFVTEEHKVSLTMITKEDQKENTQFTKRTYYI